MHGAYKATSRSRSPLIDALSQTVELLSRTGCLKRRPELRYRCSLIYKFVVLGADASARYFRLHTPVETSTAPCRRSRGSSVPFLPPGCALWQKLHYATTSLLSEPNPLRWALSRGLFNFNICFVSPAFCILHYSEFRIPHSAFRINSAFCILHCAAPPR